MELKTILDTYDLQEVLTASSFQELRLRTPEYDGQLVYLTSYYAITNTPMGCGYFVGHLTAAQDDGGMTASGVGYSWHRIVSNYSDEINISHFGAYMDGVNDDLPAVLRMFNYGRTNDTLRLLRRVGVNFPSGITFVSPHDYGATEIDFLQFSGPRTDFGLFPETRIVSDGSDKPVITCSARRTAIQGIEWDGRATSTITETPTKYELTTPSNNQPFFKNVETAGEYVNVTCFKAVNSGGHVFDLLDTLDTRFDQIYGSKCYGDFIRVMWSNDPQGKWDHSTAVEISNGNLQWMMSDNALNMPRCTQSIIRNFWIEHSNGPGDLSNGGWNIQNMSIESSKYPLNLQGARGFQNIEVQSGASVLRGIPPQRWLSNYEDGYTVDSSQAVNFERAVRILYQGGTLHGSNNTNQAKWVHIGKVFSPSVGQQWEFEIHAKNGYSGATGTTVTKNGEPGKTTIKVQRGSGATPIVTAMHEGMPGVIDILYQAPFNTYVDLWVKVPIWCGRYDVNVYTNGLNRQENGEPSMFLKDGAQFDTAPVAAEGEKPYLAPSYRFSLHTGSAGFGAIDNQVQIHSTPGTPQDATTPKEFMSFIDRNGQVAYIPVYK